MPNSYGSWRTGIQIDNIYPVGSLYFSINATNPGQLFGGTWEQIKDKFFLSAGDTYTAGSTGGSATMAHTHPQVAVSTGASSAANSGGPSTNTSGSTAISQSTMPNYKIGFLPVGVPTRHGEWTNGGIKSASQNRGSKYIVNAAQPQYTTDPQWGWDLYTNGSGNGHTHTLSSHTHTIAHTHSISATTTGAASNTNNLPPYLVIYVFKRIT